MEGVWAKSSKWFLFREFLLNILEGARKHLGAQRHSCWQISITLTCMALEQTNNDYGGFPKVTNYPLQLCHSVDSIDGRSRGTQRIVSHLLASKRFGLSNNHHEGPLTQSHSLLEEVEGMNGTECTPEWPGSQAGIQTWCLVWHALEPETTKQLKCPLSCRRGS